MPRTTRQSAAFADQAYLFCGRSLKLRQGFPEREVESDSCKRDGQHICDGLRQIHGKGFAAGEQVGHQVNQRQQQDKFPDNGRNG